MMRERWFPLQHKLPDGAALGRLMHAGPDWQIFRLKGNGRMLVARSALADRWVASQFIPDTVLQPFVSDHGTFKAFASSPDQRLESVIEGGSPDSKADGLAFALSLSETRKVDATTPLHDAIYAERFSRLLPTWTVSERATDEEVLGLWLTGGVAIPATSHRRLTALVAWLDEQDVREVVEVAGLSATASLPRGSRRVAVTIPVRPQRDCRSRQRTRVRRKYHLLTNRHEASAWPDGRCSRCSSGSTSSILSRIRSATRRSGSSSPHQWYCTARPVAARRSRSSDSPSISTGRSS